MGESTRALRRALWQHQDDLCAVVLSSPGNPLQPEYSEQELESIGRILIDSGTRVLVDSAFGAVQPSGLPLSAVTMQRNGRAIPLYEQCVTVTCTSQSHHAIAPFTIGAAVTGDRVWRAAIARQLAIPFQRATLALARVILEETPDEFVEEHRRTIMERQREARQRCVRINERVEAGAVSVLGSSPNGPSAA